MVSGIFDLNTWSRRDFLAATGSALAAASLAGCGGTDPIGPGSGTAGRIEGRVVDLQGVPQGGFGQVILMYPYGRHVGPRAVPDASGRFEFGSVPEGEWQIRFQSGGLAIVPEPYQHPVKFVVAKGKTTDVPIRIQRGNFSQNLVEIYAGDDFFQLQPDGAENAETVVRLGTVVCWYNVGLKVHTVTGGPWNDSGDLQKSQSFIWVANQVGSFGFRCVYNQPHMQSTLRVVL